MNKNKMKADIAMLESNLSECEKKLEEKERLYDYNSKTLENVNREIADLHALLDSMEGVIPIRNEQTFLNYSISARFASFLNTLIPHDRESHEKH